MRRFISIIAAVSLCLLPNIAAAQLGYGTPGNKSVLLWECYGWVSSGSFSEAVTVLNRLGYDVQHVHQDVAIDDQNSACLANMYCHNHTGGRGLIGATGHGNETGMSHEAYAKTDDGRDYRDWRANQLIAYGWSGFISGTVSDDGYGIKVSAGKIAEFFTNNQTIVFMGGCKTSSWVGTAYPGCRASLSYSNQPSAADVISDSEDFFGMLGGSEGPDYVDISSARDIVGGSFVLSGNGSTVLVPWQTEFSPENAVVPEGGMTVTFKFKGNTASNGSVSASGNGIIAILQGWSDAVTCNVFVLPHETNPGGADITLNNVSSANCTDLYASTEGGYVENGVNSAADVSFGVQNNTAIWRVGSEYQTAAYIVEASTGPTGPWQQVGTEHNPGFGEYQADVSSAIAGGKNWFRLVEREESGHKIIHGYCQPTGAGTYTPGEPPTLEELTQAIAEHQAEINNRGLAQGAAMSYIGDGETLTIYTIPDFVDAVNEYYAPYWRNYGYEVNVEAVPGRPQTAAEEDAAVVFLQSRIAANTAQGSRYHEIWGRDCDYHYLHGERWPDYWTGPWLPIHSQMENRYLSTANDVIIPAPTVRDDLPRGQNLSYWWPYFRSDKAYQVTGAVVTRVPVYELWQIAAASLVIQETNDWWSNPGGYGLGVGFFVGDMDHMQSGDGAKALAAANLVRDLLIQRGCYLSEIYESEVPNPETRNMLLAEQWNGHMGGRTNLNFLYASQSGPHYPGNMYSKRELGEYVWRMDLVSPYLNHHPFLIVPTCGGTATWATDDSYYYHTPVAVDMLFDEAGASGYYGPSCGSLTRINGKIGYQVAYRVMEDFSRPAFESITMAEEELPNLYPDEAMIPRILQTMCKLGSALTRIGQVDAIVGVGEDTPQTTAMLQNSPNPFNPKTTIRFNLKNKGRVSLKVFDIRGALVTTLADEVLLAGPQERTWNGTDKNGRQAASGTYFYRLEADGVSVSKKMLLLK